MFDYYAKDEMRGHLRKRGDRAWEISYDVGHDPRTGRRRRRWLTVRGTKRDAERRLASLLHELAEGAYVEPSLLTLRDYLDQWMTGYVSVTVRPRTAEGYRTIVRRLDSGLGRNKLADLKPRHVQRYYVDLLEQGLSAQTVRHHHRLLSQALRQAVRWDMLKHSVMDRVTAPRVARPELRSLSASEAQALLRAAQGSDFHLPIHLALHTGLRRSELLGLRWSDVDLPAQSLQSRTDDGRPLG